MADANAWRKQILHREPVRLVSSTRKSRRRDLRAYQRSAGMTTQQIRQAGIERGNPKEARP